MAAINPGDIMLATFGYDLFGQRLLNTFTYRCMVEPTERTYEEAVDEFHAKFYTAAPSVWSRLQACLSLTLQMNYLTYQVISPVRRYKIAKVVDDPGTNAATANTANLAGVITRRGELANRRNVGSLHVPAPTNDDAITDGELTQDYKDALALLASQMKATIVTTTVETEWAPCIYNPGVTPNYSLIIATEVQGTARVMRRRTKGLGI